MHLSDRPRYNAKLATMQQYSRRYVLPRSPLRCVARVASDEYSEDQKQHTPTAYFMTSCQVSPQNNFTCT